MHDSKTRYAAAPSYTPQYMTASSFSWHPGKIGRILCSSGRKEKKERPRRGRSFYIHCLIQLLCC